MSTYERLGYICWEAFILKLLYSKPLTLPSSLKPLLGTLGIDNEADDDDAS